MGPMAEPAHPNNPEVTVSELSAALKRTVEDRFGLVRVRGEISNYRGPHSSGHCYFSLKDQNARIDAVIWKGAFNRLRARLEEGLEVIATGKITTFPGKSSYQIVIESVEPAGVGALMALLEERRRKLAAEGLFDAARKQLTPFLPAVIGVVTSPTGAVIRDILHRISDRFPRHVVVWPVRVQGETAAQEVAAAIAGFNAIGHGGPLPRPDVLIVARGGGSLEDLWAFNEEIVVRAAAQSMIPLISAIGHETDTTLLDHVADLRAPTPTGAAEKVVPVRFDLLNQHGELSRRHHHQHLRWMERRWSDLRALARVLPTPDALLGPRRQFVDGAGSDLRKDMRSLLGERRRNLHGAAALLARHSPQAELARAQARLQTARRTLARDTQANMAGRRDALTALDRRLAIAFANRMDKGRLQIANRRAVVGSMQARLAPALARLVAHRREALQQRARMLASLGYTNVLARGFALVRDEDGHPVRAAAALQARQHVRLEFADGETGATIDGETAPRAKPAPRPKTPGGGQGSLF
ncbi:MAG: exodeoxyribonuclease VII large subunit [Hyphomicrobiales bacterium]|nr:exodeoxyribonuclease VII large subunit [Hyphomicrobiales bacterium]